MRKLLPAIFVLMSLGAMAQTDLLDMLNEDTLVTERVKNTFKSTRVINTQSTEQMAEGVLDFRILHRFGRVNGGAYEFFGLDQGTIRLSLDYGIWDWLMIGIGRSNNKKEFDGSVKAKLLWQTKGAKNFPFSVSYAGGTTLITLKNFSPVNSDSVHYFSERMTYYHQVVIGRKFSEKFSLELVPSLVHYNIVPQQSDPNDLFSVSAGTRMKLSKRVAITIDYNYRVTKFTSDQNYNYIGVGFDIETGGHVFQLHFTNSTGMNERAYITETTGNFQKGDIHFGFNISRVFTLKDRKHKS